MERDTYLSLEFLGRLADQRCVEDQAVLGRIMLGFKRTEESFFGSEDLNRRSRVFGEGKEGTSMSNEASSNEFSNEGRKVGSDGGHAVTEVVPQFGAVLGDGDDLVGQEEDVGQVGIGDFGSHRDGGGGLERLFELLGQDGGEVGGVVVGAEAWLRERRVSERYESDESGVDGGDSVTHPWP